MSDRSRAKPKFNFRRDGRWPESAILEALPTADAVFVALHPFYQLSAAEYQLLGDDELQLSAADAADALSVCWETVAGACEVTTISQLRWLVYGITDGLAVGATAAELVRFRRTLAKQHLICPATGAPPPELALRFAQMISECAKGESLVLERPDSPGWCRYSSTGDLFAFCLPEEPFSYLAGVRPVLQAAIEKFNPEGLFVERESRFDW